MAGSTGRHFDTTVAISGSQPKMASQGGEPEYEFEDPIESWIDLVEACRIEDMDKRKNQVTFFLNVAKNSHWTHVLFENQMLQDEDVDYTGQEDLRGSVDTEPYEDEDAESEMPVDEPSVRGSDYVPM